MMSGSARHRRYVAVYPVALFVAWVTAWIVNLALRSRTGWDTHTDTVYWISMKVIVWILPAVLAIRLLECAPVGEFMELRRPRLGLLWGLGVGVLLWPSTILERRFRRTRLRTRCSSAWCSSTPWWWRRWSRRLRCAGSS